MYLNRLNIVNKYSAGALYGIEAWKTASLFYEIWDIARTAQGSNAAGLKRGDPMYITGVPGSEIYQILNTAGYRAADTDYLWITSGLVPRSVLTPELTGYDFSRTIVKYLSLNPFTIEAIGLLDPAVDIAALTDEEKAVFYNEWKLNPYWSGTWIDAGEIKENREFDHTIWTP